MVVYTKRNAKRRHKFPSKRISVAFKELECRKITPSRQGQQILKKRQTIVWARLRNRAIRFILVKVDLIPIIEHHARRARENKGIKRGREQCRAISAGQWLLLVGNLEGLYLCLQLGNVTAQADDIVRLLGVRDQKILMSLVQGF